MKNILHRSWRGHLPDFQFKLYLSEPVTISGKNKSGLDT